MSQSTVKGPGGSCTSDSNQGEPFKTTFPPVDCVRLSDFAEVIQIPLFRDGTIGRPAMLRGELMITSGIGITNTAGPPPSNLGLIGIEVRVDAFNSAQATRIAAGLLGGVQNVMRINFDAIDTFDRLVISATGNADGEYPFLLTTALVAGVAVQFATLTASLLMWR